MAEELKFNVKTNIDDAAKDAEKLGDNIERAKDETEKLEGATKKGAKGFKGIGKAVKGVGMALKAAGIGLVVALLATLMDVFRKNQKVLDFFNTAMEALSIAFNDFFKFLNNNVGKITGWFKDIFENPKQSLIDFGDAIKKNLIERFESLMEVFGHLAKALDHLFEGEFKQAIQSVIDAEIEMVDVFTGVDNALEKVTGAVSKYVTSVVKSAKATIELNKASELAAVQQQGLIEEYDRQAEKLRQIRDDETKTFADRILANKTLGEVLTEQGKKMQKLVDIQVHAAQVEYDKNESQENLIALTEALNERKAVEAQITGFQSEQLTNQVGLEKELAEAKSEILLAGLAGIELELSELARAYELKLEMADKAGEDTTAITEQYEKEMQVIKSAYADAVTEKAKEEGDKQKEIDKSVADAKIELLKQSLAVIQGFMDVQTQQLENDYNNEIKLAEANGRSIEGIEKKYEAKRQEQAKQFKAMKIAMALVDTYQSAVAAYAQGMAVPPPAGLVIAPISAALAVAAGLANIAMIAKQPLGGGGGGGGSISAPSATPTTTVASGAFTLEGGIEPEPARAYVVSDDITDSQNALANIRRRASF